MIRFWLLPAAIWECIKVIFGGIKLYPFCKKMREENKCNWLFLGCEYCIEKNKDKVDEK